MRAIFLAAVWSVSAVGHELTLGGHAGVLDRMGAGVAELGTGNTGTGREDAVPAAYWNPALLAFSRYTAAAFGADIRSLSRNGGMICLQGRIAPNMGAGLGIINRGDFDFPVYDMNENYLGVARPQDIGFYLGVGVKTSRRNSFGSALQWYHSNKDIGGAADINSIGIINVGWYRSWSTKFKTAAVLRNLGFNSSFSANYEFKAGQAQTEFAMDETGKDFFPKTLIAAGMYTFNIMKKDLDVFVEFLNFQLVDRIFDIDRDHHAVDMRMGTEFKLIDDTSFRAGYDRGNVCFGLGYHLKIRKKKKLQFDYALILERFGTTLNPFAIGLRYEL
ncbi:hypothetical protein ACFL5V_07365 [Fibrobacterota bacterium]